MNLKQNTIYCNHTKVGIMIKNQYKPIHHPERDKHNNSLSQSGEARHFHQFSEDQKVGAIRDLELIGWAMGEGCPADTYVLNHEQL